MPETAERTTAERISWQLLGWMRGSLLNHRLVLLVEFIELALGGFPDFANLREFVRLVSAIVWRAPGFRAIFLRGLEHRLPDLVGRHDDDYDKNRDDGDVDVPLPNELSDATQRMTLHIDLALNAH